jgi:hypothetical protein
MDWNRRVRTVAAVGALAVGLGLATGPADPTAVAAPDSFTIHGAGYGHGIGMSQYGAHGMALRDASAGRIISFYYGGARAGSVGLPSTIRVGILQANHDPSAGGRLRRVLVRGPRCPAWAAAAASRSRARPPGGRAVRRRLAGGVTWSIRPESGGVSVFDLSRRRVFGPTRAGTGLIVRYQTTVPPARLLLPQTGQQLRWGRLDVSLVRDNRGVLRPRAVARLPFNHYLRGLGEMPGSFAYAALRAQAIAARSYALVAAQSRGQHSGRGSWDGCDCAVYSGVRDQLYAGYVKEQGVHGRRWVTAVRRTGRWVVRWHGRTVQAFYSSSSGGYTSSNAQWGSPTTRAGATPTTAAAAPTPTPTTAGPCGVGGLAGRPPRRRHGDRGPRGQARLLGLAGLQHYRHRRQGRPAPQRHPDRRPVPRRPRPQVDQVPRPPLTGCLPWRARPEAAARGRGRAEMGCGTSGRPVGGRCATGTPPHAWRSLVQFRSLRSLARRTVAAGAASAVALTLFNAVQPTLGARRVDPGTVKDVPIALVPAGALKAAPKGAASGAGVPKAVPGVGTQLVSAPVAVGKARFVGVSWPVPPAGPQVEGLGRVWLRARTAAGWSSWREVEPAADGPDPTSREYRRPDRVHSDGQWLEAGTAEVQLRADRPVTSANSGTTGTSDTTGTSGVSGVQAHLIAPDMTATPGTEGPRAGVATAATARPAIVSRAAWGARESLRRAGPEYSAAVKAAFIHHTVQSNRYAPSESAALVRADYLYHVRSRGWNDIGYNFLVDRHGRVFEGRYGGVTRAVPGAHSGGFNTNTTGGGHARDLHHQPAPGAHAGGAEAAAGLEAGPDPRRPDRQDHPPERRRPPTSATRPAASCSPAPSSGTGPPPTPPARAARPSPCCAPSAGRVRPEAGVPTGVYARFSSKARWRVTVTESNAATVRSFAGVDSQARVRWSGRAASGALAPPGWAKVTVTARAGGAWARPAVSRVFVDRTAPPAGTSTGGFSAGAWAVSNANAEQLSTSSRVFGAYRWGRAGDIPVVGDCDGDGTQTVGVVRPNRAAGTNRFLLRNSSGPALGFNYAQHEHGRPGRSGRPVRAGRRPLPGRRLGRRRRLHPGGPAGRHLLVPQRRRERALGVPHPVRAPR